MSNLLDKASIILTPTAYNNGEALCVKPSDGSGDFDFSRNSAATRVNAQGLVENVQILSSNLVQNGDFSEEGVQEVSNGSFSQEGAEEISNGDFSNGSTDWALNGWTIIDGKANCSGIATANLIQSNVGGANKNFKLVFTISDYASGVVRPAFVGLNAESPDFSGNGTYTLYISSLTDLRFVFYGSSFNGSIDNVSVREVGQDWTLGTGWSIGEDKAICDGTSSILRQPNVIPLSTIVKVSFNINDYVSGNVTVKFAPNQYPVLLNGNGTYTIYTNGDNTANGDLQLISNSFIGSITNISVKEVGQNWNLVSANASIGENKLIANSVVTENIATQSGVVPISKPIILKFDLILNSGGFRVLAGSGGTATNITTSGTYTLYETSGTGGTLTLQSRFGSFDGSVTNLSIIEISTDTNLPRINYEGFSYQDALGSELVTNGDFATDTAWLKGLGWSIGGGTANGLATLDPIRQSISGFTTGKKYKVSFEITEVTNGFIRVYSYVGASGTFTKVLETPSQIGTYEVIFEFGGTNKNLMFYGSVGNGNFTGSIDNVSVKEYLGQEVVPDSGCGSWLWEPQTTQLVPYSEDFSQYSVGGSPVINGGFLAPDGTNNAYKVTNSGSSTLYLSGIPNLSSTSTRSIYARSVSGTGTASLMSYFGNTNNLFTLTEQWQRFEVNVTTTTTGEGNFYAADFRGSGTLTEYLIWGANATNDQDYATSYIPTSGSTVTRNQDVCTNGGSLASINSTEGVFYAEIAALANDGTPREITLNDGTENNRVIISYNTSNNIRINYRVNGVNVFDRTHTATITDFNKIALKWSLNDFSFFVNGLEISSSLSGQVISSNTLDVIDFDNSVGNFNFFGKTKAVAVFPYLTDQELTELTTI